MRQFRRQHLLACLRLVVDSDTLLAAAGNSSNSRICTCMLRCPTTRLRGVVGACADASVVGLVPYLKGCRGPPIHCWMHMTAIRALAGQPAPRGNRCVRCPGLTGDDDRDREAVVSLIGRLSCAAALLIAGCLEWGALCEGDAKSDWSRFASACALLVYPLP